MIDQLKEFQGMVHATARSKGFHSKPTNLATKIALAHSELSEALEADRAPSDTVISDVQRRTLVAEELADCIIRILDMAESHRLPVVEMLVAKAEVNKTRPHMHGGKLY